MVKWERTGIVEAFRRFKVPAFENRLQLSMKSSNLVILKGPQYYDQ